MAVILNQALTFTVAIQVTERFDFINLAIL
jgi:hypothetical protein